MGDASDVAIDRVECEEAKLQRRAEMQARGESYGPVRLEREKMNNGEDWVVRTGMDEAVESLLAIAPYLRASEVDGTDYKGELNDGVRCADDNESRGGDFNEHGMDDMYA